MKAILAMPYDQRDWAVAQWFLVVMEDMRCRPLPSMPVAVRDFYKKQPEARKAMTSEPEKYMAFWSAPSVKKYFDDALYVQHLNSRNKTSILWTRGFYANDAQALMRIDKYLGEYSKVRAFSKLEWPLMGIAGGDQIDPLASGETIKEEDIVWPEE